MYKVAIISCGMIATNAHIPAYLSESDRLSVVAVCDVVEEIAKKTAEKFNIPKYYTDVEKMLAENHPDIVSVCAPNGLHKKYTLMALLNGANVLCEKPLSANYADAKEMFDVAEKMGKTLMACQSLRCLPERLAVNEMLKEDKIGDIYYADVSRIRRRGIPTWGKFHIKSYSGGGAFLDIGVHAIDSLLWFMGNPKCKSVRAIMKKVHEDEMGSLASAGALKGNVSSKEFNPDEMDVESFSAGEITFENGAVATFKVAWAANLQEENNIVLAGKKCGVDIENRKVFKGTDECFDLEVKENGFKDEPFFGHFCLVKNMADVLDGKDVPFVKPEETIQLASILEAAYKSAYENREVLISEIEG